MNDDIARRKAIEHTVRSCYASWGESYYEDYYGNRAPYPPIQVDLIKRLLREAGTKTLLDAGCGPASFLRTLMDEPLDLYGFDLTPEMLTEGRRIFDAKGLDSGRLWQGSIVDPAAFRSPAPGAPTHFDAVVSVGVMPHIAPEDDARVFANALAALRPGGTAIIEARNELFGLFTLNRYTHELFHDTLIPVERIRAAAGEEAPALETALTELESMFRTDLPPRRTGTADNPGYDEVLSRTHNPLVVRDQMMEVGFADVRILFYHFHCLPPMFGNRVPALFRQESLAMEAHPDDWRGHFLASAFLVTGRRR